MKGRLNLGVAALGMGVAFAAAVPGRAGCGGLDDDLAVVKKAVQGEAMAAPTAPSAQAGPSADTAPMRTRTTRGPGQWLKVRIVEGSGKRSRITVSLPLSVARALGGDLPIELGDQKVRLSDALRTLEGGESLVEVTKRDAAVRVWIE